MPNLGDKIVPEELSLNKIKPNLDIQHKRDSDDDDEEDQLAEENQIGKLIIKTRTKIFTTLSNVGNSIT